MGDDIEAGRRSPADEHEARALAARFADVVNRRALDELPALWTDNGTLVTPAGEVTGAQAIADTIGGFLTRHQRLVHMLFSGEVTIEGDTAHGRWYLAELAAGVDGVTRMFVGTYHDDLVATPSGWRFQSRRYEPALRLSGTIDVEVP